MRERERERERERKECFPVAELYRDLAKKQSGWQSVGGKTIFLF
jgi:hypothetical protein